MVIGLLGNESSGLNRFILVILKPENGVRLQATLENQNPTGLPVGAVSYLETYCPEEILKKKLFLFIPFYILRYEKQIKEINSTTPPEVLLQSIRMDFQKLDDGIYQYFQQKDMIYYYQLINDLTRNVLDAVLPPDEQIIRNEVNHIMGGHVLVTPTTIIHDRGFRKGVRSERANTARERKLKVQEQQRADHEHVELEKWKAIALSLEKGKQ